MVELCGANLGACPPGSKTGDFISPSGGFTSDTFASPAGIVLDQENNAWISNSTSPGSITELLGADPLASISFGGGGLDFPVSLSLDGAGSVWVANTAGPSGSGGPSGSVTEIPVENALPLGFQTRSPTQRNLVIDGGGNVWIANTAATGSVSSLGGIAEFLGAAAPVVTPALGLPSLAGLQLP